MTLEDLMGSHILSGIEAGSESYTDWHYGGCRNFIKFTLDGVTYLAKEDPADGYRSYLKDLEIVEGKCKVPLPNIRVLCRMRSADEQYWRRQEDEILSFLDAENGKEILAIGTANTNDYYPYCVLEYHPENMACNSLVNKEEQPPAEREEQTKYDSLLHLYATLDKECAWRHVTDGLPTPNQLCEVTVRSGAGAIVREGEYVEEAQAWIVGGELISGGSGDASPAVTDWRPMPKPAGAWK